MPSLVTQEEAITTEFPDSMDDEPVPNEVEVFLNLADGVVTKEESAKEPPGY